MSTLNYTGLRQAFNLSGNQMRVLRNIFYLAIVILICSCSTDGSRRFFTYKQNPQFIKSFLDTVHHGKFRIAEKGERWNSGCIKTADMPSYQFVSASMNSNKYELKFLGGGIVGPYEETMVIRFNKEKVLDYHIVDKGQR